MRSRSHCSHWSEVHDPPQCRASGTAVFRRLHASYEAALLAPFKALERHAAWYRLWYVLTKLQDAVVEQAVAHEVYQVPKLFLTEPDRSLQQRSNASREHPRERAGGQVMGN